MLLYEAGSVCPFLPITMDALLERPCSSEPTSPSNGGHLNYINLYHKVTFSVQSKSCQEKGNEEE